MWRISRGRASGLVAWFGVEVARSWVMGEGEGRFDDRERLVVVMMGGCWSEVVASFLGGFA